MRLVRALIFILFLFRRSSALTENSATDNPKCMDLAGAAAVDLASEAAQRHIGRHRNREADDELERSWSAHTRQTEGDVPVSFY